MRCDDLRVRMGEGGAGPFAVILEDLYVLDSPVRGEVVIPFAVRAEDPLDLSIV